MKTIAGIECSVINNLSTPKSFSVWPNTEIYKTSKERDSLLPRIASAIGGYIVGSIVMKKGDLPVA